MRRNAMQQLYDWKEKSTRKPLIIRGARQVGKEIEICNMGFQS